MTTGDVIPRDLMTKKTDPVANATPAETAAAIEAADTAAEEGKKEDGQQ